MDRLKRVKLLGLAAIGAILIAGCGKGEMANDSAYRTDTAKSEATAPLHNAARTVGGDRNVVRHARMTVQVDNLDNAEKQLKSAVTQQGGYVVYESGTDLGGSQPVMSLEIRVPEKTFELMVGGIEGLGKRTEKSITASDITEQVLDLEAQLHQAKQNADVLSQTKNPTYNPGFASIKNQIKNLEQERDAMVNRSSMSSIDLTLQQKPGAPGSDAATAGWGSDTWNAALSSASNVFRFFGAIGIWLLAFSPVWLLGLVIGYFVLRRQRRATA